jgi:hypothetical protein
MLWNTVLTIHITCFNNRNSIFWPYSVFMSFISVSQRKVIIIQQSYANYRDSGPGVQGQQLIKLWLVGSRPYGWPGVRQTVAHINNHRIPNKHKILVKNLVGINHFRDLVENKKTESRLILYKQHLRKQTEFSWSLQPDTRKCRSNFNIWLTRDFCIILSWKICKGNI